MTKLRGDKARRGDSPVACHRAWRRRLVFDRGKATISEGAVENPNVSVIVSAEDGKASQRGELGRTQAWLGGKLKVEGNVACRCGL